MKDRIVTILLCLSALLLGGMLRSTISPVSAQVAASPLTQAGRYSMSATQYDVYFIDTQTGRMWHQNTSFGGKPGWKAFPAPIRGLGTR
jgi:hypothetical protein